MDGYGLNRPLNIEKVYITGYAKYAALSEEEIMNPNKLYIVDPTVEEAKEILKQREIKKARDTLKKYGEIV